MNNPEALFRFLQICGVLFACAAGVCMILAAALFLVSRKEQGQPPFTGMPAPGGQVLRTAPVHGDSGATEVLRGRGRQFSEGYGDAAAFGTAHGPYAAAGNARRQLTRFEIVKENILIHSDEEITEN